MTERESERAVVAGVVVEAWRDEAYRGRLVADAAAVLSEAGLELPAGCRVTVLENTAAVWHVAVPRLDAPAAGDPESLAAELAAMLPLPAGVELRLHQSTAEERFLVLPLPPQQVDTLNDEELRLVVGGGNGGAGGICYPFNPIVGSGGNGGNGGTGGTAGISGAGLGLY